MVVGVQIRPAHPCGTRQPPERRVNAAIAVDGLVGTPHQQLFDALQVIGKSAGPRASDRLIELGPRGNAGLPTHRKVKSDPFDERALKDARRLARPQFARHHQERVAQMTDHLLNGHDAPFAGGLCVQRFEPRQQLVAIAPPCQ